MIFYPQENLCPGQDQDSLPACLQATGALLGRGENPEQEVLVSHQLLGWSGSRATSLRVRTTFCWKQLSPAAWQCSFSWMRVSAVWIDGLNSHLYILAPDISWCLFLASDWTFEYLCAGASPLLGGDSCTGQRLWSQRSHSSVGVCLAGVRNDLPAWFPFPCSFMTSGWSARCSVEGLWLQDVFPNCTYQDVDIFSSETLWCVQKRWIF